MHAQAHRNNAGTVIAFLIGTACAAALLASSAQASGPATGNKARAEPWLGRITLEAGTPAARTGAPSASPRTALATVAGSASDMADRIKWWSVGGPAYRWNEIALDEVQDAFVVLPMAARHLALVHAALDDAVAGARQHKLAQRAGTASGAGPAGATASQDAAAAEAAAAVLTYLFPGRAAHFAAKAEEAISVREKGGAETPESIAAGRAIGQKVGALAVARGQSDGSDAKWTGSVPEGAGLWKGTSPVAPLAGTWRPWVLASQSELRPKAPPAVDSEQVKAALGELKAFARTPKTNHRATYWEVHGGARAHTLWNEIARAKLLEYATAPDTSAHVLAALNIAMADAGVACWDAKFAFWLIRPTQLDSELKSLFPPPNHPSYPAAHGCFSTAAATVLAGVFGRDRERLLALGREAAEARVWAGIHYRFDIEAGQEIGRKVGEKVLARAGLGPVM